MSDGVKVTEAVSGTIVVAEEISSLNGGTLSPAQKLQRVGNAFVTGDGVAVDASTGAGAADSGTQRVIHASNDPLVAFVDGLETLIGATNTALATIAGYVDGLEGLATALNGYTDGLETLIGTSNTSLASLVTAASSAAAQNVTLNTEKLTLSDGTQLTPKFAKIAASTNGENSLVAAVSGKKIRVLGYNIMFAGTVNAKFVSDVIAGSPVDLTGLKYGTANGGLCAQFNPLGWFETAVGKALMLNLSAGVAAGGELVYVEVA